MIGRVPGPFHVVLREAIHQRGLPLERLRSRLAQQGIRVGLATLSDWQHGRTSPRRPHSLKAVGALEEILELPPRTLTGLLRAPRLGVDERSGALGELLQAVPRAYSWDLEPITVEHTVTVGADRRTATLGIRSLVRARRDGVDRTTLRYFGAQDGVIDQVAVRPVRNCATGRLLRHDPGGALVVEVLFGQPLAAGETWLYECEVHNPAASTDFAHGFRQPEGTFLLEVRFHPDALPAVVRGYYRADLYDGRHRVTELPLNTHHAVHITAEGMAAGVVGINWEWQRSPDGDP
ncbi:hypothetical protein FKR81_03120 [Lentzea tibetensis]|uniref:Uncharacterized protein n=1 Tax=Lentzea tibetensis TaxID=2591470 RepID=A0A563F1U0_9PSEU|nr:hypothetical protein [Lentzea tibetensis]TWP53762.1 hypothetical protein FKR81_03120 [Lentzea tibetensis]